MKKKRYMFKLIFLLVFGITLYCFKYAKQQIACKYTIERDGTLADYVYDSGVTKEFVNREYAEVQSNPITLHGYLFNLKEYYYDSSSGNVIFGILIQKEETNQLSDKEFNKISQELCKDDLYISIKDEISSSPYREKLVRKNKDTYLYQANLVSAIDGNEKNGLSPERLCKLNISWKDESVDLVLPNYNARKEIRNIDVSKNKNSLKFVQISADSLNLVWDLETIMSAHEEQLKKEEQRLNKKLDREMYPYTVYDSVVLVMQNGEEVSVEENAEKNKFREVFFQKNETKRLANLRIIFGEDLNIENLKEIVIDGEVYKNN